MPFESDRQRRFMYAKHPRIARRWTREAKKKGEPVTKSLTEISKKLPSAARAAIGGRSAPDSMNLWHNEGSVMDLIEAQRQGRIGTPAGRMFGAHHKKKWLELTEQEVSPPSRYHVLAQQRRSELQGKRGGHLKSVG